MGSTVFAGRPGQFVADRARWRCAHGSAKVLDVAFWKYEVGNDVNFVGHRTTRSETFKSQREGARDTVVLQYSDTI